MFMKSNYLSRLSTIGIAGRQLHSFLLFAISFGGLKLNALSAALLLSNFFPGLTAFGEFEYALSIGLLLCLPFNLGLQAATPYFLLKQKRQDFYPIFYFHGLLLLGIFLIGLLLYLMINGFSFNVFSLSLSIAIIFSLQILASTLSKTQEKIYSAVFIDGAFFILLNSYNLYLYCYSASASLPILQLLLLLQITLLALFYGYRFSKSKADFTWQKYKAALQFGRPILLSTFLILGLTATGRIFAGYYFDLAAVAIYGIYFRLAAVVIIAHQIVNIAYFKKIYASKSETLDLWFERFLGGIILLSAGVYFFVPTIAQYFFEMVRSTWASSQDLFLALLFQMFFWICLALFENIIARENLATAFNKRLLPLFIFMVSLFGICQYFNILSLSSLVFINTFCLYLAVEVQLALLKKRNAAFPKTRLIVRSCMLLSIIFQFLQF